MGNRTSHTRFATGRYSERGFSRLDADAWEQRFSQRRPGSVQAYLQPPSTTLSEYLKLHSAKYRATGDPEAEETIVVSSFDDPYPQTRDFAKFHPGSPYQDASEISSRSTSVERSQTKQTMTRMSIQQQRRRPERGDLRTEGSSASNVHCKSLVRRTSSGCTSASRSRITRSGCSGGLSHQMGFQTQPDGLITYTAFLRSGPCGVPVDGWLNEIRRKASRYLTGLHRQYQCTVRIEPRLISYRGFYVHALLITGAKQSDLIRCRNALPGCIEKYLITPYANHGPIITAR
ncbi:unnamed protein product [Echinostoma caproni]|uniref:IRS-type PTB domain-containing protein n=1 Tax=Echinostoma caproni TaxID=27848 RepID=A0A183AA89_9TREM|nr:unnamed protein product [Echinostoma caproni]